MIVYRVCKEEEYYQLLHDKNFSNIGYYFNNDETKTINTHKYNEDIKYLHFFKNLNTSISYLNIEKGMYICKYDIPEDILKEAKGLGYYIDMYNYNHNEVIEYAIESNKLKFDYLKQVIYITEYVDPQKFYRGAYIMDFGEIVYDLINVPFDNQTHDIDMAIEDIIQLLPKAQNESVELNDLFNKIILDYKSSENPNIKKLVK